VGAMKGGTSTLAYMLGCQDNIILPSKEINYFDNDKNFKKGHAWYLKQFRSKDYTKIWGEKTATYHYDPKVPERIYQYDPNMKLIWILRNPTFRAYSNYWHRVKYGGEYDTFEVAIQKELAGKQKDIWGMYLKRSNYIEQIKQYNNYFDEGQMCIIIFEEFIKDIEKNLKNVLNFLGLDLDKPNVPPRKKSNVTHLPGAPILLKSSRKILGKSLPFKVIRKMFEKKLPGYPEMNNNIKALLNDYFNDSIEELEKSLNMDLNIWKRS
jgi:hypothetical protein